MICLITQISSIANSDQKKITDIAIKSGEKAKYDGILVHEDMYRYLRAEEERAVNLETELIIANDKDKPSKISFMIPLSVGLAVGVLGATYLKNQDALVSVSVGMIAGGLVVFSFQ